MDKNLFWSAAFDSFWNWLFGGVMLIIGVITFFYPNLQPVLNWPTLSQVLPPLGWLAIGIIIWSIGFAWNVRKRLRDKQTEKIAHQENMIIEGKDFKDSQVIKADRLQNVAGRDIYNIQFPKNTTEQSSQPKIAIENLSDLGENGKFHQIRDDEKGEDAWKIISTREYGTAIFANKIREANGGRITLSTGTYLNVPSISSLIKNFTTAEIALEICRLAENFKDRFGHIRDQATLEGEVSEVTAGKNLWILRKDQTERVFYKLRDLFEPAKFQYDCRKDVEDNLQKLFGIFQRYSNSVNMWVSLSSSPLYHGNSLNGLVDAVFGSPATQYINEVDATVETIVQLFIPYIRGEK
jgi:hypothetical protein